MSSSVENKSWISRNKWLVLDILSSGFLCWVPFVVMGVKAKVKKWIGYGAFYSITWIIGMVIIANGDEKSITYNIGLAVYILIWLASMPHIFIINKEYLLRLKAIENVKPHNESVEIKNYEEEYKEKFKDINVNSINSNKNEQTINSEIKDSPKKDEIKVIDINSDSEYQISELPGIGIVLAKKIVSIREKNGMFNSLEELGEKLELKPHIVERIRPYVKFSKIEKKDINNDKTSYGRTIDF